jgi:hypothetical protein
LFHVEQFLMWEAIPEMFHVEQSRLRRVLLERTAMRESGWQNRATLFQLLFRETLRVCLLGENLSGEFPQFS